MPALSQSTPSMTVRTSSGALVPSSLGSSGNVAPKSRRQEEFAQIFDLTDEVLDGAYPPPPKKKQYLIMAYYSFELRYHPFLLQRNVNRLFLCLPGRHTLVSWQDVHNKALCLLPLPDIQKNHSKYPF